jgi:phospholipase/carboxylesterase
VGLKPLETVTVETGPNPTFTIIWMHGLGADGNDFVPIVGELRLPATAGIRFVFPHAPTRPVTINNGYVMRAWYDITGSDMTNRGDVAGIRVSQRRVEQLIAREKARGIKASRIVLAGFSQGGVIALQTALRHPERLAGIMALSTYLAMPQALAKEASAANRDIPIFMAHGTGDPMIQYAWAETSRRTLEGQGWKVEWHAYPMQHSVCLEEVVDIGAWLRTVLGLGA